MHLYPEGMAMASPGMGDTERMWKTGLCVVGGALFGFVLDLMFPDHGHGGHGGHGGHDEHTHAENGQEAAENGMSTALKTDVDKDATKDDEEAARNAGRMVLPQHSFCDVSNIRPTAWNLCMGDACHNITDGVMIGAAFLSCSRQMGWVICGVMLAHELPGEIGDFFLLINAGMSLAQALFWNFFSGLTAVAGLMVVFLADVNARALGLLLLVGSGVFIYIAFANLMPEILKAPSGKEKNIQIFGFFFGVLCLGLTVAGHQHCNAAEGSAMSHLHAHGEGSPSHH